MDPGNFPAGRNDYMYSSLQRTLDLMKRYYYAKKRRRDVILKHWRYYYAMYPMRPYLFVSQSPVCAHLLV